MARDDATGPETTSAAALDSVAWEGMQEAVRSFRRALRRGERPSIEASAARGGAHRGAMLAELIHEEMELAADRGDVPRLAPYLERFPELLDDPRRLAELAGTEARLRRLAGEATADARPGPDTADAPGPPAPIGRYELGEVIGRGAFGVVHRAYDTTLRRAVALKRPRPGTVETDEAAERFLREARAVAGLSHPNIVPIYDAGRADGVLHLVGELIEGRDLAAEMVAGRPGFRRSAGWVAALADALDHAHRAGIIHRDVKPSNVLIDAEDRPYLTDFGLARSDGGEATLTADGQVIGTPAYMAPEQARGEAPSIGPRTDIYSLGVILYELLTGSRPFAGAGAMLLARIREEDPRPPRRLDPAIPRDLETVCLKAMAKEPTDRYDDAAGLAADLRRWLAGEPVTARPTGPIGTLWRRSRRRPLASGLAAAFLLAVVAGLVGVTREWRRAESFRRRAAANLIAMQAERDRAIRALDQGHRSLEALNRLALSGQLNHLKPRFRRELTALLSEHFRVYRREATDEPVQRLEQAKAAFLLARHVEDRGAPGEGLAACREALELCEELAREAPEGVGTLELLGECLELEAVALRRLGRARDAEESLARARDAIRRAVDLAESALARDPRIPVLRRQSAACLLGLGRIQQALGDIPAAIAALRRAQGRAVANLRCGQPEEEQEARRLAAMAFVQAVRALADGREDEAIAEARDAIGWIDAMPTDDPSSPSAREGLALVFYIVAAGEDRVGRSADAMRHLRRAAAIYDRLERESQTAFVDRSNQAATHHIIGRLHVEGGRPGEALAPYRKAVAIREELLRADPDSRTARDDCAGSWHRLGEALENLGRLDEARDAYRKSIGYRRPLVARVPGEAGYRNALDETLRDLSRLAGKMGRPDVADEAARERRALAPDDRSAALGASPSRPPAGALQ